MNATDLYHFKIGLTKTEINLRRLLAAMPQQTNQAKLAQYVVTLREQLALLTGESGQGSLPCISEEKAKEYAGQIEVAASRVNTNELSMWDMLSSKEGVLDVPKGPRGSLMDLQEDSLTTSGLRKRLISGSHGNRNKSPSRGLDSSGGEHGGIWKSESKPSSALKIDSATLALIDKHRHLQDDLTDEMVDLARQMKEASLAMNQAVLATENVLDSTERAVEHSLAATNQANTRAQAVYSYSFKTGCLTWLIIFFMSCMFLLMVFLIRIT
ncbi:hypothetical protein GOP47_0009368 [Adiantum capillus-veneris]|uniref:Uncharacterized protein n=1 Tax=Adiantum capillus-veneris TaxID=13818 RepID=A0A9D4ZIM6_ADICA|nr:hypothetical protein GOP47_0009368 [Adiantum capillus-veneris]